MKRFYREAVALAAGEAFAVHLDGKPLQTPAKRALILPGRALAAAIAAEWQGQGETLKTVDLPLTRLASTAIDRVAPNPRPVIREIANYAGTDLLCYRAPEPPELVARQHAAWQTLLDWIEERCAAKLVATRSITPVTQAPEALAAIERAIERQGAMELAALHLATAACGSVVLGLALLEERLDPDAAFEAAQLDETYQMERWGEDAEQTRRRAALKEDIRLAARFLGLLRAD